MNKSIEKVVVSIAVLAICMCSVSVSLFNDSEDSDAATPTFTVGVYGYALLNAITTGLSSSSGVPDGMSLVVYRAGSVPDNGTAGLYIVGTPTTAGLYTVKYQQMSTTQRTAFVTVNPAPSYSVSYDSNGGSLSPGIQSVTSGSTVVLPNAGDKNGYSFDGWYTSLDGGSRIGSSGDPYTVTYNVTFYAHWNINQCTISFDANGGSTPNAQTQNIWSSIQLPSSSRDGYSFNGWYTASNGSTRVGGAGDSYTVTSSLTLCAQWSQITYTHTLQYDGNTGNGAPSAQSVTDVNTSTALTVSSTVPVRTGYAFLGWADSSDAVVAQYSAGSSVAVGANATKIVYAVWQQITISVTSTPTGYSDGKVGTLIGNGYCYTPSASVSGCTVTVSGASWLSSNGTTVSGTPTTAGSYSVTVSMAKGGYVTGTQTFTVVVGSVLTFSSLPTVSVYAYVG